MSEKEVVADGAVALVLAKQNKEDVKNLGDSVEELRKGTETSNIQAAVLSSKFESLEKSVEKSFCDFTNKLDTLMQRPAKQWHGLTNTLINGGVMLIIGYLFTNAMK